MSASVSHRWRWLAALLLFTAQPARAQLLHVRISETLTGRPLAGAIVEVLDSTETVVRQGLLGDDGGRSIPLAHPGTYHVRLRRIGFQPFVGPAILVPARATVDQLLEAPAQRVVLSTLSVSAAPRCARDAFGDPAFVTLWEEVRKALTSTVLSREGTGFSTEIRGFRRRLDTDRNVRDEMVGLPRVTGADRPYVARPADSLSREGYVRFANGSTEFYAPDERVLLSDEFVDDHCFRVQRGTEANEGEIGVHFLPARGRKVADIEGTVWIDSASAQLQHVEFWYWMTGMPQPAVGEDRSGGQIVFGLTPARQWIVTAWRLRMPHFEAGRTLTWRSQPDWYEEVGGVVSPARGDTTAPAPILLPYLALLAPARVFGTVFDSLAMRPLRAANVWLLPRETSDVLDAGLAPAGKPSVSPVVVRTDSAGRYAIPSTPAGPYRLAFEHASFDSVGQSLPHFDVQLRPGTALLADVSTPSLATLARACTWAATDSAHRPAGLVTGMVTTAGDVHPIANAVVVVSWYDLSRMRQGIAATRTPVVVQARTDDEGVYHACGLPDSTIATVRAAGPHASTGEVQAQLGSYGLARVNLRLAEVDSGQPAPAPSAIAGTVSDSLSGPVRDAVVTVDGTTLETRTDSLGRFRIAGVTPGTQTLLVRRLGAEGARTTIDLVPGLTSTVQLSIVKARLLEERLITATRTSRPEIAAVERRHRNGVGTLLREDQIKASPTLQSLFNGLPGVRTVLGGGGTDMQWIALMRRGAGECEARLFVDNHQISYDQLAAFTPNDIEAVEVYVRPGTAPVFTTGSETCGVILMWTKR